MGVVQAVLQPIGELYTYPNYVWHLGGFADNMVAIMFGIAIYGITATMVCKVAIWSIKKYLWYSRRQRCHNCGDWTTRLSGGNYPDSCLPGTPCCPDCAQWHEASHQPRLQCPIDGVVMDKLIIDGLIVDGCPVCDGNFLNGGELNKFR